MKNKTGRNILYKTLGAAGLIVLLSGSPAFADGMPRGVSPAPTNNSAPAKAPEKSPQEQMDYVSKPAKQKPAVKPAKQTITSAKLNLHAPKDYDTFLQRMMISELVADSYASGNFYTEDITNFRLSAPSALVAKFDDCWSAAGVSKDDIARLFDGDYLNGEGTAVTEKEYTGKAGSHYAWLIQVARGDSIVYNEDGLTVRDVHGKLEFKVFQSITNPEGNKKFLEGLKTVYDWTVAEGRIAAERKYKQDVANKIKMLQGSSISVIGSNGIEMVSETGHIIVPPGTYNFKLNLPVPASNVNMWIYEENHPVMALPLAASVTNSLESRLDAGSKDVTVRVSNFWDCVVPFFRCTSLKNEKHPAPENYMLRWEADGVSGSAVVVVLPPEYMERLGRDKAFINMLTGYFIGKSVGKADAEKNIPSSYGGHGSSGGPGVIVH